MLIFLLHRLFLKFCSQNCPLILSGLQSLEFCFCKRLFFTLILLSSWYPEPSFYRIEFFQPHLRGFDRVLPGKISSRISFGDSFWISFLSKNKLMKRPPIVCKNDEQVKQKLKSALFYKADLEARNNIEWEWYAYESFILFRF